MSGFDAPLLAARKRQRRVLRWLGAGAGVLAVSAAGFLLLGGLSVRVLPAEAEIRAKVQVVGGWAVAVGTRVYTLPGAVLLRVESEGFHPEEVDLFDDRRTGFIEVTLRELPGRLRVGTRPLEPAVEWSLDGKSVAVGERLDLSLESGVYTLGIDSPRHQTESIQLEITRGGETDLMVDLEPVLRPLEVITQPAGATVSLDGVVAGSTPGRWEVGVGAYQIEVTLSGWQSISETVQVTKAISEIQRSYELLPDDGFVSFRLRPEGGQLLLDGRIQKNLNNVPVRALESHHVAYRKDGHVGVEKDFRLQPSERATIELSLQETVGEVEVVAKPAGDVWVDGKLVGTTPVRLKLSASPHEIVVTRQGYVTVTRKVTPVLNRLSLIDIRLQTEKEARLQAASEVAQNSIGMTLHLFEEPGEIVMGSPRGERGRRANEFLRTVRLVRTIYASVHEVTQAQLGEFRGGAPPAGSGDLPAVDVTWIEAVHMCNWLSARESLRPFYRLGGGRYLGVDGNADGYRLPTEAEWEWLARKSGRWVQTQFPWGDDVKVPPQAGNLADESAKGKVGKYIPNYTDGFAGLAPVGRFKPNEAGIHDLAGNVREWMHDAYVPIPPTGGGEEVDPRRDQPTGSHVVRGSSWRSASLSELRAAYRSSSEEAGDDLGFRMVRYLYGNENTANR